MRTLQIKQDFIELRAQGFSFDKIAGKLKVSKATLVEWSKELEEEIASLKAVELEALYEKYSLLKQHRIINFGELLERVKKELGKRDLENISTERLIDIYFKTYTMAKDEYIEPVFKSSSEIKEAKENREQLDELTAPEPDESSRELKTG